jgi:hypothetical protein
LTALRQARVRVAAEAAKAARLQRRNARNQVPIDILAFLVSADLVAAAGGAAVGPSGVSAAASARSGKAASASGRASAGIEGKEASGDCQPAPFTEVFPFHWEHPLRILPASADRPKPAKSCLRVSAALPVPYVPPPLKRRPVVGRAVLTRRAR